jgi:transcriptional regulator with XRE-family HTH domain
MGRQRLSGLKLAMIMGWTQQSLTRRLTGKTPLSVDELDQIARALRVPIGDLLEAAQLPPRRRAG